MENQEIINKIQTLQKIKPRKDWILETKKSLFRREVLIVEKETQEHFSLRKFQLPRLQFPFPSLVPAFFLLFLLLGITFLFLSYHQTRMSLPVSEKQPSLVQIIASLTELQASLEKIGQDLESLKKSKTPAQALVMTEVVKAAVKNVEKTVSEVQPSEKESSSSPQVLATLNGIRETSQELVQESERVKREMIQTLIEELNKRMLTDVDKERLQMAKNAYNEGKYNAAMVLIARIYNKQHH